MARQPKHINTVKKKLPDGTYKTYYYDRRTGKRIETNAKPGSRSFAMAVEAVRSESKPKLDRNLAHIIDLYLKSPEFDGLAKSTKTEYRRYLMQMKAKFGDMSYEVLEDPEFRQEYYQWRNEVLKRSKRSADYVLQVGSMLMNWAMDQSILTVNRLARMKKVYKSDRSDIVWTQEDIQKLISVAHPKLLWMMAFGVYTAQRVSDLIALKWENVQIDENDNMFLAFTQQKGDRYVEIPVHQDLRRVIEQLPQNKHGLLLTSIRHRPWTVTNFDHQWRKACDKVEGLEHLHFHDLRGTAITMMAETSSDAMHIATITGHTLKSMHAILDRYFSRTRKIANRTIRRLESHPQQGFITWLDVDPAAEGTANQTANQEEEFDGVPS